MLKNLDFLRYNPQISINGNFGYKTFVGAILSVVIAILIILCSIGFGEDILFREKPTSFVTEIFDASPKLESSKILIALAPGLLGGIAIPNITSYLNIIYGSVDTVSQVIGASYNFYKPERCIDTKRYTEDPILNATKTLYPTDQYFCPPQELSNLEIEGIYGSNNRFKALDIRILPCQNTTEFNQCKSSEEIKSMLNLFYIGLIVQTNIVNPLNYTNPISTQYYTSLIRLTSNGSRQESIHLRLLDFFSDTGFILSTKNQESTYMYDHSLSDSVYDPNPLFFLRMLVSGHSVRSQYFREYLKIQKIAADVGGIIKFILIFAGLFNSLYAHESLNVNIIKNLIEKYAPDSISVPLREYCNSSSIRINLMKSKCEASKNEHDQVPEIKKSTSHSANNFIIQSKMKSDYTSK